MNLSLAGCGFLGIYHAGVASCFKEYAPNILVNKISGASAGSMAACCLICGCSMGEITSDILKIATTARKYTFGPFNPRFQVGKILRDALNSVLPDNAHVLCTNRLHVSVTRVYDGQNVILSEFHSKDELIQALLCSSFIPFFSGFSPETFRGVRYIDGCYSNNLPILDENTVTVSPFCGESDICPRDNSYNLFQVNLANTSIELSPQNLYRIMRILFPPHPEILSEMCKQGFDDALRFLQKNNLISCTRCVAVNSILEIQETDELADLEDEEEEACSGACEECRQRREVAAMTDAFPEAVLNVLEEATLSMNSGLINWVFKHKTTRVLSILTIPYVLPYDIMQAAYARCKELVPKLSVDLNLLAMWLFQYIKNMFRKFGSESPLCSAKLTCQLAITEYDVSDGIPIRPMLRSAPGSRRNSMYTGSSRSPRPRSGDWSSCCPHRESQQQQQFLPVPHSDGTGSRRQSCFNFEFSVDMAGIPPSSTKPLSKALNADRREEKAVDLANAALSLDPSLMLDAELVASDQHADTFDQVLQVTKQHDSIMAYYYLDDNNQMKVTEIFDATDPEVGAALMPDEMEVSRKLEWDESFVSLSPRLNSSELEEFYSSLDDTAMYDSATDFDSYEEGVKVDCAPNKEYLSLTDI